MSSEEFFVKQRDIPFQVLLGFFQNPFFEINKIESVGVFDSFCPQPVDEMWEVVGNFLTNENTVDHMAAEQPHFDLVPQVQVNLLVLMDALEYVRSG